jgi:DNA-binding transcriptional ArsR family regulator
MVDSKTLARIMKVLSVEARVEILRLLAKRPLCVNALAARLGITQGAVSQHLRVMRDSGLLTDDKRGFYVHYSLNREALDRWRGEILSLLEGCGGDKPSDSEGSDGVG